MKVLIIAMRLSKQSGLGLCRIGRGGYRSADTSVGLLETKDR